MQRIWPLEGAPLVAIAVPVIGLIALLVLVVRARPSLGETALAVDAESGSGDAIASALAFAGSMPETASALDATDTDETILIGDGFDLHDAEGRFVRRQRRDALGRLHATDPGLFGPRLARRPALVALVAAALVIPGRRRLGHRAGERERGRDRVSGAALGVNGEGRLAERRAGADDEDQQREEAEDRDRDGDERRALERPDALRDDEHQLDDRDGGEDVPRAANATAEPQAATVRGEPSPELRERRVGETSWTARTMSTIETIAIAADARGQ